MIYRVLFAFVLLFSASWTHVPAEAAPPSPGVIYINPLPGAKNINAETSISVRYSATLDAGVLSPAWFAVSGSKSGTHSGHIDISDDGVTLIFKPAAQFALGETVHAAVNAPGFAPVAFDFQVRALPQVVSKDNPLYPSGDPPSGLQSVQPSAAQTAKGTIAPYTAVTLPADYPAIQVTTPANGTADGYVFSALFPWLNGSSPTYLLILDNNGQPVYYQKQSGGGLATDFKKQPNGWLTYFDNSLLTYFALNSSYQVVDTFKIGNGYLTDLHDLQILPNGHALLMALDVEPVDMTGYGGQADARVVGLIIQELDQSKNVVFEWRSWDHMQITDTYVSLTTAQVDYVHPNAVELDQDGNILLSSRHLHEVTKIDRQTGAIIWRMSGKNNEFNFTNDPGMFHWQHDIRRLPNGNITLFDNNSLTLPGASRAIEYQVDETSKTVSKVWDYINPIPLLSVAMGDVQRLSNGNTLIGWGSGVGTASMDAFPNLTEVKPDGSKAFEMMFPAQQVSYRSFRFPWHGHPDWAPTLVARSQDQDVTLYYSWNGATDISAYKVYASKRDQPVPTDLIATQSKTAFEDSTALTNGSDPYCYFRVMPLDTQGHDTQASEIVPNPACFQTTYTYLPYITTSDTSLFASK